MLCVAVVRLRDRGKRDRGKGWEGKLNSYYMRGKKLEKDVEIFEAFECTQMMR